MCCGCGSSPRPSRFRSECLHCGAVYLGEMPDACALCSSTSFRVTPHPAELPDPGLLEDPDNRPYVWE